MVLTRLLSGQVQVLFGEVFHPTGPPLALFSVSILKRLKLRFSTGFGHSSPFGLGPQRRVRGHWALHSLCPANPYRPR